MWIGLSRNFLFPLADKPVLTREDFSSLCEGPLISGARFLPDQDNVTDLAVWTDNVPFLTPTFVAGNILVAIGTKTVLPGTALNATVSSCKDPVIKRWAWSLKRPKRSDRCE